MGISSVVSDFFKDEKVQNTTAGVIDGVVGLVDLGSQGLAYGINKATGSNIEPLQYAPMIQNALGLKVNPESAEYVSGSLVGGALTGGAGLIKSGFQQGVKQGVKAFGKSLSEEAAAYGASTAGAAVGREIGGDTGELIGGLAGGMSGGSTASRTTDRMEIFGGARSQTVDDMMLDMAVKMENKGVRPQNIFDKTGFFRGADNNWRYEIDDSNSSARGVFEGEGDVPAYKVLQHDELYRAYPDLAYMRVRPMTQNEIIESGGSSGFFSDFRNEIGVNPRESADLQRGTLLHEMQHAVQNWEGHSRGGSSSRAQGALDEMYNYEIKNNLPENVYDIALEHRHRQLEISPLYTARHILSLQNINQPKQLFNDMSWYEHSDKVRQRLGAPPKRGSTLPYAQEAGRLVAQLEMDKLKNSVWTEPTLMDLMPDLEIGTRETLDRVNKQIRSLEGKNKRLYEKGQLADYNALNNKYERLNQLSDYEKYRFLEGEAEAFNTEARMKLGAEERRALFPSLTMGGESRLLEYPNTFKDLITTPSSMVRARMYDGGYGILSGDK